MHSFYTWSVSNRNISIGRLAVDRTGISARCLQYTVVCCRGSCRAGSVGEQPASYGRPIGQAIIFCSWGSCPLTEFCQVQNSLCVQVLRSPILAALLHGTRAVCVNQTLRRSAEGATITLSIGPHSRLSVTFWLVRRRVRSCSGSTALPPNQSSLRRSRRRKTAIQTRRNRCRRRSRSRRSSAAATGPLSVSSLAWRWGTSISCGPWRRGRLSLMLDS